MIKGYDCGLTEEFFLIGNMKKTKEFNKQSALQRLTRLDNAVSIADMKSEYIGYKSEKSGWHSVWIAEVYKLCFKFKGEHAYHVKIIRSSDECSKNE